MRSLVSACLATAALLIGVNLAPAQTTLSYKFDKGQKIPYVIKQNINMAMEIGGQAIVIKMNQTIDQVWEVKKVANDGSAEIVQRITRLQCTMDTPQAKIEYDTKTDKEPEDEVGKLLASLYRAMVNEDIGMKLSSRGSVSNVKVPEKILDAFKKDPKLAQFGTMFTDAGMKQLMAQSMIVFPDKALNKNESWKNDPVEIKNAGVDASVLITNQFDGTEKVDGKELAKFTRKLKMEFKPNQAVTLKVKSEDAKATVMFDIAGGFLTSTDMKQKMVFEVTQNDMTIIMNLDQTIQMKLAK